MEDNNLFNYATKELSQDAVLCWILHDKKLGPKFLTDLLKYNVSGQEIGNESSQKQTSIESIDSEIRQQEEKRDIYIGEVTTKGDKRHLSVIIEDKTDTSLHDNQVKRYIDCVREKNGDIEIHFVLVKTGYYYFWERDEFQKDIEDLNKENVHGHYYSRQNLLDFIKENKLNSGWEADYKEYLEARNKEYNAKKVDWFVDLKQTTGDLQKLLLNDSNDLSLRIFKPHNTIGDRDFSVSIFGIHGEKVSADVSKIDINKNYYLYVYATLSSTVSEETEQKKNELKIKNVVIQYNIFYDEASATEKSIGYMPINRMKNNHLQQWKDQKELIKKNICEEYPDAKPRNNAQLQLFNRKLDVTFSDATLIESIKPVIDIARKIESKFFTNKQN